MMTVKDLHIQTAVAQIHAVVTVVTVQKYVDAAAVDIVVVVVADNGEVPAVVDIVDRVVVQKVVAVVVVEAHLLPALG